MADKIDLEGKTPDELRQVLKDASTTVDEMKRTGDPGFGFAPPEETGPITREDALKAIADLEQAFLAAQIKDKWEEQARVIKGIRERTERLQKYGLSERPPVIRHPLRPRLADQTAQRRQQEMFQVDEVCENCKIKITELPFEPTPGKPVYCQKCWQERRGKTTVGHAFDKSIEGEQNRLKTWEEGLQQRDEALNSGASAEKARGKLSKKERHAQERAEREAREDT